MAVGDLFVDVGSNVGSYTIWVGESGAEAIASERPEDTFCLLRENVALNGYPSRLTQMEKCAAEWSREFFCSGLCLPRVAAELLCFFVSLLAFTAPCS